MVAVLSAVGVLLSALVTGVNPVLNASAATVTSEWTTYLHDVQRTAAQNDTSLTPANVAGLTQTWSFKTESIVAASPTVAGNTLYVGSWDGYEYALNSFTGALIWKTFLGRTVAGGTCGSAGVTSGAAVVNGTVYVGGGDAFWYALDAATGAVLWKVFTGDNSVAGGHYNWSSPLIYGGFGYIGVASFGDCPLVQGQLLKVDLSTHLVVATFNFVPNGQTGAGIWTSPSLDPVTNTIYVTTGTITSLDQKMAEAIVSLDAATLTLKGSWRVPGASPALDRDFGNTPILFDAGGRHFVSGTNKNGVAYTLDRDNVPAGPVWSYQIAVAGGDPTTQGGSVSSDAFGGGRLYIAGNQTTIGGKTFPGSVRAFDPATGALLWEHGGPGTVVPALAYNNGVVFDGSGGTLEALDAATGAVLYSDPIGSKIWSAPSVASGYVYFGSNDGSVRALSLPTCPSPWNCTDIGVTFPTGAQATDSGTWAVTGGGTDIGGTTDQFHYVSQSLAGSGTFSAHISSITAVDPWTKGGLMLRSTLDPAAPFYDAVVTGANGLHVEYRPAQGAASVALVGVASTGPQWLQVARSGSALSTYTSSDGVTWNLVPGSTIDLGISALMLAGMVVSSHHAGWSSTVVLDTVSLANTTPPPPPPPCPSGWTCSAVGNPQPPGGQSLSNGAWSVVGGGADIWGVADQFQFVSQTVNGDVGLTARLVYQNNTDPWAKAGLMLRLTADPGSPTYQLVMTPLNGLHTQYRLAQGGASADLGAIAASPLPTFIQVARAGSVFSAYTSPDGTHWTLVPNSTIDLGITAPLMAGMAVNSHNVAVAGTGTFDTVTFGAGPPPPPPPTICPTGWTCGPIGNPTPAGSESAPSGTWTIAAGGADIWGNSDQFEFARQPLTADGTISARVKSQSFTDQWAKAGVMLRATADPGSAFYAVVLTPTNGLHVQFRPSAGAAAVELATSGVTVPSFVQIARSGSTFTAYTSPDGVTWSLVLGSSLQLGLTDPILEGIAVTSHNPAALSTVVIDSVTFGTPPPPPVTCPSPWACADIGSPTPAGSETYSSGVWTVAGGGTDIWGLSDQFNLISQSLAGDGAISARVTSPTNTNAWAKAGMMLRQGYSPGAAFYDAVMTPAMGLRIQYRPSAGAAAVELMGTFPPSPVYMQVARSGGTFTTYGSSDGISWTVIPGSVVQLNIPGPLIAGLVVTSHNPATLSTARFDSVNVTATPPPAPPPCPAPWSCGGVGNPLPGSQSVAADGTWTIHGGGTDIWGTSDQFQYVWQGLAGPGAISAHVSGQTATDPWAKAGVMIRQTADASSAYYAIAVTPKNGIVVQYRPSAGAAALDAAKVPGVAPAFVKVAISGSTFTAYTSTDGINWSLVAGSTKTIPGFTGPVLAGLAVCAHTTKPILSTVVMDQVVVG